MIIFTTITNAYDTIPVHHYDPGVKYVLFYDKPVEQKGPWEFIKIPEEGDPVLKSYRIRCLSHLWFDEPHVWVDACYRMDETFADRSRDILSTGEITLQHHPEKRTLLGEFMKVYRWGFLPEDSLLKLARDIRTIGYRPSMFDHTINCCMWRHNTPAVAEFNAEYWRWFVGDKLYRCDQITSAVAQYLVFGKNVPRVDVQVDLSESTRAKPYSHNYPLVQPKDEKVFQKKLRKVLGAVV
jgi:hypothetical protein